MLWLLTKVETAYYFIFKGTVCTKSQVERKEWLIVIKILLVPAENNTTNWLNIFKFFLTRLFTIFIE